MLVAIPILLDRTRLLSILDIDLSTISATEFIRPSKSLGGSCSQPGHLMTVQPIANKSRSAMPILVPSAQSRSTPSFISGQ
jgi:hypothetical protein